MSRYQRNYQDASKIALGRCLSWYPQGFDTRIHYIWNGIIWAKFDMKVKEEKTTRHTMVIKGGYNLTTMARWEVLGCRKEG